jgi:DNA processing protein
MNPIKSNNEEILHALALKHTPGVGDIIAKSLVMFFGSAQAAFRKSEAQLIKVPGIGAQTAAEICKKRDLKIAEKEFDFILQNSIKFFYFLDDDYPARLKSIPDSPILLFGSGNMNLNPARILAIVGTRKCSEYGRELCRDIVASIKDQSCLVISGLALGIDTAAHKYAVDFNVPTIGVLGSGLKKFYPYQNKNLAEQMKENGGVLTEFISNTPPDAENFPKRNRIVAGMCDALVVVETAVKGGAKITAEIANSYNKDVMAFPGRPNDEYSLGCNQLIRDNKAILINSPDDLLKDLGWNSISTKPLQQSLFFQLTEEEGRIIEILRQKKSVAIDDLAFALKMDQSYLSLKLLELEFSGFLRALPGKCYELR